MEALNQFQAPPTSILSPRYCGTTLDPQALLYASMHNSGLQTDLSL